MYQVGRQNTGVKKAVAEWAKAAALKHNQERMAGREVIIVMVKLLVVWCWWWRWWRRGGNSSDSSV